MVCQGGISGQAGKPNRQRIAAVQITAQCHMAKAAQREEVIHMTAHGIEIRLPAWRKKRRIKVDSHKSAGFTDGAKLFIGEIAPVWAQGGGIGMAGHHRLLGKIHEIPKGAL